MKRCAVILFLTMTSIGVSSEVCTFDQDHQKKVTQSVSQAYPGALRSKDDVLSWDLPGSKKESFSYGGCVDLGSIVTQSIPATTPRTKVEVMEVARSLAEKYWKQRLIGSDTARLALLTAIASNTLTTARVDGGEIYEVTHPGFVQLYVDHRLENGVDTVTIAHQELL